MGKENRNNKVLFSGYAKLHEGTYGAEVNKTIGVVVIVDMSADGRVIDAECTLPTAVARKLVAEILIGHPLAAGPERLVAEIAAAFQDSAMRPLIAAIRIVCSRYANHVRGERTPHTIPLLPELRYGNRDATAS